MNEVGKSLVISGRTESRLYASYLFSCGCGKFVSGQRISPAEL